jgi:fibronectin-binding autotransporter adhesin
MKNSLPPPLLTSKSGFVVLLILFALRGPLVAAPFGLWINANTTNSYSNASNWTAIDGALSGPGGIPGPSNDAYIFDGTVLVTNGGNFNPQQLIMGWESFHVGEFLQTGGTTRTEFWTKVGLAGNQVFNMSGGTYSAADLAVGWSNSVTSAVGTGVMNLSGGTFESRAATFIGLDGATGTVNISAGTYNATGNEWGSFRIADFGTGTGTLNLSGTGVVNASLYTAVGGNGNGTLNISGGTWNQAAGGIVVGDAADLSWTGSGVVNQTGGTVDADYVLLQKGTYNLDGGDLSVYGVADTKAETTGVFNFNGGTLRARDNNADFITANTVEIKSGGGTIDTADKEVRVTLGMTGTGGLTKTGSGTLLLSAANSYSAGTTISAGTLELGDGGSVVGNITNNATLSVNRTDSSTLLNAISGTGGLSKSGAGTATLTAANSYQGATTISAGVLRIGNSGALGSTNSGTVVQSGAQLRLIAGVAGASSFGNGEALTISGDGGSYLGALRSGVGGETNTYEGKVTLAANATINAGSGTDLILDVASGDAVDLGVNTLTFVGAGTQAVKDRIVGTGGLTKDGTGVLTLAASNSFTGAVQVALGTLNLDSSSAGAVGAVSSISVATNATLLVSQNSQVNDSASVTLSGGTIQRASGVSEVFGNLNLTESSFLDFGGGTAGTITFNGLSYTPSASLALDIANFNQGSSLVFQTTNSLSMTGFTFSGTGGFGSSSFDGSTFTITAIPEPSTWLVAAGLSFLLLAGTLFKRSHRTSSIQIFGCAGDGCPKRPQVF